MGLPTSSRTIDRATLTTLANRSTVREWLPPVNAIYAALTTPAAKASCRPCTRKTTLSEAMISTAKDQLVNLFSARPDLVSKLKRELGANELRIKVARPQANKVVIYKY
jgi:hypothetical protein